MAAKYPYCQRDKKTLAISRLISILAPYPTELVESLADALEREPKKKSDTPLTLRLAQSDINTIPDNRGSRQ